MKKAERRRGGLRAVLLGLASLACGSPQQPLNVVLVTLDTTRADALGVYGQELPTSPRIDALAADGALFVQALTSTPSTLPAHATILTGREPYAHGVRSNGGYVLSDANETLAERLRDHGYRTAAHVAAPVIGRRTQLDQGFEEYEAPGGAESTPTGFAIAARDAAPGFARPERDGDEITNSGIAYLRAHREEPFFLWLHYFDPHTVYAPPEPFRSRIPSSRYHAEVLATDHEVGRLVDEIVALGLRERTLLVLTADHGEGLGEHGEPTHSYLVYESTLRVPLLFWGPPAVPRGTRVSAVVRHIDIAPTVLDLLGLPPLEEIEGSTLVPLLAGRSQDSPRVAYAESLEPAALFGLPVLRTVRIGRWKYVHKSEPELFDLKTDPDELDNLIDARPRVVARLRAVLAEQIERAPAPPAGARSALDARLRDELLALGYVAGAAVEGSVPTDTLELWGPDPRRRIEDYREYIKAWGDYRNGTYERAARRFRKLWRREPDRPLILFGLVAALERLDASEDLLPLLRRGIEIDPGQTRYPVGLALWTAKTRPFVESEPLLRHALELDPCAAALRLFLAEGLRAAGRYAEQFQSLDPADATCGASPVVRNARAWALATSPDATLRDGARAVELAEAVVADTGGRNPDYLDTLAAAYAETGAFGRAMEHSREALALIEASGLGDPMLAIFQEHLAQFESGRPLRVR